MFERWSCDMEGSQKMNIEDSPEILVAECFQRTISIVACIVDQDVDLAEMIEGGLMMALPPSGVATLCVQATAS